MSQEPATLVLRNVTLLGAPRALPGAKASGRHLAAQDTSKPPQRDLDTPYSMERDVAEARRLAHKSGYDDGFREGMAAAQQRIDSTVNDLRLRAERESEAASRQRAKGMQDLQDQFELAMREIKTRTDSHLQELEAAAIELAFTSIQKILCPADQRAQILREIISKHVSSLHAATDITIHLNADDFGLLQPTDSNADGRVAISWVSNVDLARGSCLLKSNLGQIDASIDTQLSRLREVWLAALAEPTSNDGEPTA